MLLSIIIPVYNEESTVEKIVNDVINVPLSIDKEIIIIDDCSTDNTKNILESKLKNKVKTIIYHAKNRGKGASIRDGVEKATGDMVIVQDADFEYDPNEYQKLIQPILNNKADVVYGSRFMGSEPHRMLYFWHYVGNKILTILSNMFSNLNLTDMETCYKLFRKEVIKKIRIEEDRFGFEPEITAKIAKMNLRIYEVGISYDGRTYKEGKKIGFKDALRAFYCIIKYNIFR